MNAIIPKTRTQLLCILFAISSASLITANLCAIKNESVFGLTLGAGISTIVIDYIVSDLCAEVYGLKTALSMRRMAVACNVAAVLLLHVVVMLPADPEFAIQREFSIIFTAAPLLVVASMTAYMAGTYVNDRLIQKWHDRDGENGLFKRCIASTVFGGLVDTLVFNLIAYGSFYSIASNIENTVLTYALKIAIEVVVFSLITKRVIKWAKNLR